VNTISIELLGMHYIVTQVSNLKMAIDGHTTVNDAIEFVMRKYPAFPLNKNMLTAAVNHEVVSPDTVLNSDDIVTLLPPIGGG
jgi:molybdopterin converting factor small subunit